MPTLQKALMALSFVFAALLLLCGASAAAQEQQGAEMRIPPASRLLAGPVVGMNYTTLYGSGANGTVARTDYAIGGQLDYPFGRVGLFRSGVLYSRRGGVVANAGLPSELRVSYLEVPLLLGYRFHAGSVRPFLIGGGHLAFETGCSIGVRRGRWTLAGREQVTEMAECNAPGVALSIASTDVALLGGGGLLVPFGTSDITVDLRYAVGLTRLERSSDVRNRGLTVGMGIMMPIAR